MGATTSYTVSSAETVKLWEKMLLVETKKQTYFDKFIGTDSSNIIQLTTKAEKEPGDNVKFTLRMQLTGDGTSGDTQLANSGEEALTTYTDSVTLDQLRHAVQSAGRMTNQRVSFDIRTESLAALADWWSTRIDVSIMNQLAGNSNQSNVKYTGMNAVTEPDSDHFIIPASGSPADESGLLASDVFTLSLVDAAVEKARTLSPAIRPVKIGGKEYFVMFLHPYQVYDLRTTTSTGQWLDIQKAVVSGGGQNRIMDGSLGVYNGVILHESANVPEPATSNVRRAIFCGAQAGLMGYGNPDKSVATNANKKNINRYQWVEETFDYANRTGVAAGAVFGMKKTIFNSLDFATIVVSTYAASHAV